MAEYRRTVGLEVINPGMDRALAAQSRGIEAIADVVARRENDLINKRKREGAIKGSAGGIEAARNEEEAPTKAGALDFLFGQSAFNQAYNDAAQDAWVETSNHKIRQDISELESQFPRDIEGYTQAVEEYKSGLMEGAGDNGVFLGELINRHNATAAAKVLANQREWGLKQISAGYASSVMDSREQILDGVRAGDDNEVEAGMASYITTQRKRLDMGMIELEEYDTSIRELTNEVVEQGVYTRFDEAYDTGDGVEYISQLMDKGVAGYEGDPEKIYKELGTRLRRRVALDNQEEESNTLTRTQRHNENEAILREASINGMLTIDLVESLVPNDGLSTGAYLKWGKLAAQGPVLFSDGNIVLEYETDLLSYDREDIEASLYITNADKQRLIGEWDKRNDGWASNQWAREDTRRIKNEIGLSDGPMDGAETNLVKKANRALSEWYDRVESLPPEAREEASRKKADEVVKQYKIENTRKEIQDVQRLIDAADKAAGEKGITDTSQRNFYNSRKKALSDLQAELEKLTGG